MAIWNYRFINKQNNERKITLTNLHEILRKKDYEIIEYIAEIAHLTETIDDLRNGTSGGKNNV